MGSSMVIGWEMLGDEFFFFHGGYRNSWLVYNGKSHLEMDDDWGYPYCRKSPYLCIGIQLQYEMIPDVFYGRWIYLPIISLTLFATENGP